MHVCDFSTPGIVKFVFNSSRKKVSLELRNCIILWYRDFLTGGKVCIVKIEKWLVYPESRYVNLNHAILYVVLYILGAIHHMIIICGTQV